MRFVLFAFGSAFVTAFLLTPLCRAWARQRGLLDVPNDVSSHSVPTPRNGGIAIVAGIAVALFASGALRSPDAARLLGPALAVVIVSQLDEIRPVRRLYRLIVHVAIAIVAALILPPVIHPAFMAFWLVGAINGFNFMDGLNGLSSSAAVVCGLTLAALGIRNGDSLGAVLGLAIAGAAAGFLPWNMPAGSIFMGDTGSATLGFLIGATTLHVAANGVPLLAAALPLLSFVSDAFLAVVRRAAKGERFFATRHKSHFYQLLNQSGFSHPGVTAIWTMLMTSASVAALVYEQLDTPGRAAIVAAVVLLHALVFTAIAWYRPRPQNS